MRGLFVLIGVALMLPLAVELGIILFPLGVALIGLSSLMRAVR
jgi:hypothetical protein